MPTDKDFTIVTVATHIPQQEYYCFGEFIKSVGDNAELLILDRAYTNYSGLTSKPNGLHKAIVQGLINTEYLLFVDSFDLIFAFPPRLLYETYRAVYGDKVVVSAEKNCYPADLKEEYDLMGQGRAYRYLNSGMIIGKTKDILTCLNKMGAPNLEGDHWDEEKKVQVNPNDQFEWMKLYLNAPVPMALDYDQRLCNCLHSVELDEIEFNEDGIRNKTTGFYPCSLHMNGNAKSGKLKSPVLRALNLI